MGATTRRHMNQPFITAQAKPRWFGLLCALLFTTICFASMTGRLRPHWVDDTRSYVEYPLDSLPDALLSVRTPGYPIFLRVVSAVFGFAAVPLIQWVFHAVASWGFAVQIDRWRNLGGAQRSVTGSFPIWLLGFSVAFGCTAVDHLNTISTDGVAAASGVMLVAVTLRWVRLERTHRDASFIIMISAFVIMLRPAYLAVIPWLVIGGAGLILLKRRRCTTHHPRPKRLKLISDVFLPPLFVSLIVFGGLIGWMALRAVVVNDFGVLPFGHHNLAGVSLQLATDDELRQLDVEQQPFIESIIRHRDKAIMKGLIDADLSNKSTMAMEKRWNPLIYRAVVPATLEMEPEDPVLRHRMIGKLNRSIVVSHPGLYARWIALASRRAVWGSAANAMMNPVLLAMFCGLLVVMCLRMFGFGIVDRLGTLGPDATPALLVVAVSYAVVMTGFVLLTSPPFGRFADPTAIFMPGLVMVIMLDAGRTNAPASQTE